ncbi:hypothetical protein BU17DRAFT_72168 [Hysterangium stoloniferum]|nr:hypothetical protein BU17DRAFT_72168 [Hysterangium stoloniferum]
MWSAVVILSSMRVMDKEGGPSLKNRVIQDSGIWEESGNSGDMTSTLQPVPAPNSSLRPVLPGLTPASPVRKPPLSQYSILPLSQPFLPVVNRRHFLLPGRRLLWLIGHVEVPGVDEPSVRSKVAAASDSGSETPVE